MTQIAPLDSRSLIKISGSDAVSFLQNLITCEVETLSAGQANFGALLTPQGKILFDFFLQRTEDGFLIDVDENQLADFSKRLTFYKLRADVDIQPVDERVFALWDGGDDRGFTDPRSGDMGRRFFGNGLETNATGADWHAMRITHGMPQSGFDFELGSAFPHEVLMDQFGGVDFTKGCYVGQEVVSRMHHRGTARNRMICVEAADDSGLPDADTEVLALERKIGTMGSSSGANGLALVRLDRAATAIEDGTPVTVDGISLNLSRPAFAEYEWAHGAK